MLPPASLKTGRMKASAESDSTLSPKKFNRENQATNKKVMIKPLLPGIVMKKDTLYSESPSGGLLIVL